MEGMASIPYFSANGIFISTMICTGPNISQVVGVLIQFMANLGHEHFVVVKRLIGHL
jgi:hypothetical protein